MADIDVVPKKGGMGWMLWLVLAVIALLVVWMMMRGGDTATSSIAPGLEPAAITHSAVEARLA